MKFHFWLARRRGKVETYRSVFPLSLVLGLGSQQVWITAVEIRSDYPIRGTDHVTVVFDLDVAREFALLPEAAPSHRQS
jgi:hypothetical protein